MKDQGNLFDLRPTDRGYPNGPGWTEGTTSKEAARKILPHVTAQQQLIVAFLRERGASGGTYLEIADGAGVLAQSVCGRMVELVQAGAVRKAEFTRPTPSGRRAKVYVFVEDRK